MFSLWSSCNTLKHTSLIICNKKKLEETSEGEKTKKQYGKRNQKKPFSGKISWWRGSGKMDEKLEITITTLWIGIWKRRKKKSRNWKNCGFFCLFGLERRFCELGITKRKTKGKREDLTQSASTRYSLSLSHLLEEREWNEERVYGIMSRIPGSWWKCAGLLCPWEVHIDPSKFAIGPYQYIAETIISLLAPTLSHNPFFLPFFPFSFSCLTKFSLVHRTQWNNDSVFVFWFSNNSTKS